MSFIPRAAMALDNLGLKAGPEIDDLLHVQLHVPQELHPGLDGRNPAPAAGLAVAVPDAADGHQVGRAEDDAVEPHGHSLDDVAPGAEPAASHEDDVIAEAVTHQLLVADGDRILHVHSHLALDDVGGGAGPSPGPVDPDLDHHLIVLGDPGKARDDELDIGRRRDLDGDGRPAVDHPDGVDKGLDILDGVTVVEREGGDEADPLSHPAKEGDEAEDLPAEEVASHTLFCALAVGNDHAPGLADRLLRDAEEAGLELGRDEVLVLGRHDGDVLDRHGGRVPFQRLEDLLVFRGFVELLVNLLKDLLDGRQLPFLHEPAEEENLLVRETEGVPFRIENVVSRVSSLSGIHLGAEFLRGKDPGAPGPRADRSDRHARTHERRLQLELGCDLETR